MVAAFQFMLRHVLVWCGVFSEESNVIGTFVCGRVHRISCEKGKHSSDKMFL